MLGSLAAVAALVAAVVTVAVLSSLGHGPPTRPEPEVVLELSGDDQDPAPSLVGDDVTGDVLPTESFSRLEGGLGSFADYRGTPLVVNFFASWCAPCVAEMPDFEAVHQEQGDQVAFIGVNLRDQVGAARALVEQTGVTYDIVRDPAGDLASALGVVAMPSTLFVSAEGRVIDMAAGELSADELRQRVDELVGP
ncbi:hypothetical protein BH20ACT1_BH20ACT1_10370 [soil metagenome]